MTTTLASEDPRAELTASLSEEAKTLIIESANDKGGTILKIATLSGRFLQTNGKTFGDPSDRRSSARWEHALDSLVSAGIVVARGIKDQVFEMAEFGYQLAEYLKNSGK